MKIWQRPGDLARAFAVFVLGVNLVLSPGPGQAADPGGPPIDIRESPSLGPADAPITIVEFADFQCVHCRRNAIALRSVHEALSDPGPMGLQALSAQLRRGRYAAPPGRARRR